MKIRELLLCELDQHQMPQTEPAPAVPVAQPSGGGPPLRDYGADRNQPMTTREPVASPWRYGGDSASTVIARSPRAPSVPTAAPIPRAGAMNVGRSAQIMGGNPGAVGRSMGGGRGGGGLTGQVDIMGHPLPVTQKPGGENTAL